MFEQTFRNIDDVLWKEAGLRSPTQILKEINTLDKQAAEIMKKIGGLI